MYLFGSFGKRVSGTTVRREDEKISKVMAIPDGSIVFFPASIPVRVGTLSFGETASVLFLPCVSSFL